MVSKESIFETYQDKKIYITGHTGFKGSWLLATLLRCYPKEIRGIALENEETKSLHNGIISSSKDTGVRITSCIHDIRDYNFVMNDIKTFKPDYIFHLAAQPLVLESYKNPRDTYETNVMGTLNVLDAFKDLKKDCVCMIITTDKVYENKEWCYPYRENDALGGIDPYSSSKACCEILSKSYFDSFVTKSKWNKKLFTVRAGNVFGGGDFSENRIIPDLFKAYFNQKPLEIRNPKSTRPWQHVLDPIWGYLSISSYFQKYEGNIFESFNLGPKTESICNVISLIEMFKSFINVEVSMPKLDPNLHEATNLSLDISYIKEIIGWTPLIDLNTAIKICTEWYIAFDKNPDSIGDFSSQQIDNFLATIS